ncbi:MAG: FGGY family carbohydrate kinase, partial [Chloroflexota bacterium]
MAAYLGIDLGTTHTKAGLFDETGRALQIAARPALVERSPHGYSYYDPERLWQALQALLDELLAPGSGLPNSAERLPAAVGVASMAETGLLLDPHSGAARAPLLPWFDPLAAEQAERLRAAATAQDFLRRGLRPSAKYGLMKLLWLQQRQPELLDGAVWLSAADY